MWAIDPPLGLWAWHSLPRLPRPPMWPPMFCMHAFCSLQILWGMDWPHGSSARTWRGRRVMWCRRILQHRLRPSLKGYALSLHSRLAFGGAAFKRSCVQPPPFSNVFRLHWYSFNNRDENISHVRRQEQRINFMLCEFIIQLHRNLQVAISGVVPRYATDAFVTDMNRRFIEANAQMFREQCQVWGPQLRPLPSVSKYHVRTSCKRHEAQPYHRPTQEHEQCDAKKNERHAHKWDE